MRILPRPAHVGRTAADLSPMGPQAAPARFSRTTFLAAAYFGALLIASGMLHDANPFMRASAPVRAMLVLGIGVAVHRRWMAQSVGESALFLAGLALVSLRLLVLDTVPTDQAALAVMAAGSLSLPLALLLGPREHRATWAVGSVAVVLGIGGLHLVPREPAGFVVILGYMAFLAVLLLALERNARTADEVWGMAFTDELTGLPNRRSLQVALDAAVSEVVEDPESRAALMMVDLDHFKVLNDQAGHAAGDAALRDVAMVLRSILGQDAVVGRWGGEEFLVLLRGADTADANALAERLRNAIADASPVTASVGLTDATPLDDVFSLLQRADAALYRAKANGRDRVAVAHALTDEGGTLNRVQLLEPADRTGLRERATDLRTGGERGGDARAGDVQAGDARDVRRDVDLLPEVRGDRSAHDTGA